MDSSYVIRRMQAHELPLALSWAAQEGWNPGIQDASSFFQADPHGFFVGILAGEIIAVASSVCYDEGFSFFGLYIVKPEHRGQGYGLQLSQACLDYAANRTSGLDGVLEQVSHYERSGYKTAYLTHRYQCRAFDTKITDTALLPLHHVDFSLVDRYDRTLFPAMRTQFLQAWLSQNGSVGLAHCQGQRLRGYAVLRPCQTGYKIGPLFSDDHAIAEQLLLALLAKIPEQTVTIDIPEPNTAAIALALKMGMQPGFTTARMYRNGLPKLDLSKVYGITSLELG